MTSFEQHQAETAEALGYATVDEMNAEHDPLHIALASCLAEFEPELRWLGSPTLAALAKGEELDHDWVRYEEAMVLAAQRFLNAWRQRR